MTPTERHADDLVKRLRIPHRTLEPILREAADRIEQLEAERDRLTRAFGPPGSPCPWKDTGELVAENASLRDKLAAVRAALEKIDGAFRISEPGLYDALIAAWKLTGEVE